MSKYTDDVYAATGLVNPWQVGQRYHCPVIYFHTQHAHAFGTRDHRAQVVFYRGDDRCQSKPIRVRENVHTLSLSREVHFKAAVEWAEKAGLQVEEWVPSGWPDTWIPADVKDRIKVELKNWRKQQRAADKRQ